MRGFLWGFLLADLWVRLMLWSTSLGLTTAVMTALQAWPSGSPLAGDLGVTLLWARRIGQWVILFNVVYLLELLVVRLPIPTPKEGIYSTKGLPNRQLVWVTLLGVLTKARYQAPFPGFLVFHLANLPPLCWLVSRIFGPKSKSCYVTEPEILDPSLVEIGRNVIIGYGTRIVAHIQEPDKVTIRKTIIEDDVLVGGEVSILAGVRLRKGCVIGARSLLLPGTVVGPYEFWAGVPAKRISSLQQERPSQGT
ncbi:MAG: acyltransferase [Phycisphaerae bacterium]